ncbi:MAG: prepilin peptidase [Candidatus Absconditabacteria bacterium]|nr:prepilin peptidase [Candidatus Absconditabacteria bacterium]
MYLVVFLLGTIFGSLGSVLLTRLEDDISRRKIKGILFGFSKCPHCHKRLQAKNLIPLISFGLQKGKCSFCKKPISRQYPILEITSGLVFMFSYYLVFDVGSYFIPKGLHLMYYIFRAITNWGLLLLIIQDIKKHELHMPIRIFTTARILIRQFVGLIGNYQGTVIASIIFTSIFLLIYFGAKIYIKIKYKSEQEGFGQGDIFLGFSLGALVSTIEQFNAINISLQNHLKIIISIIFIAAILGLIYAGIIGLLKKQTTISIANKQKITIPFFPTLIISFWIILLYGDQIISYLFL